MFYNRKRLLRMWWHSDPLTLCNDCSPLPLRAGRLVMNLMARHHIVPQDDSQMTMSNAKFEVVVGVHDRCNEGGQKLFASRVFEHEDYNNPRADNDIAILEVTSQHHCHSLPSFREISSSTTGCGLPASLTGALQSQLDLL